MPQNIYTTGDLVTTVAHGDCHAYLTSRESTRVNLAMSNALLVTDAIRRQESYLFGSTPREW